jgi:hypothetical protein
MPSATVARASTQDGSSGTPVAQGVNEQGGSPTPIIQTMIAEGNKSTYSVGSRTGLTAADAPTGGDMTTGAFAGASGANLTAVNNALAAELRATCGTASAVLTGRLALYDESNNFLAFSETIQFVSDATLRLGNATGDFVCQRAIVDLGRAVKARFFVDSVSAGTWAIYLNPL